MGIKTGRKAITATGRRTPSRGKALIAAAGPNVGLISTRRLTPAQTARATQNSSAAVPNTRARRAPKNAVPQNSNRRQITRRGFTPL